MQIYLGPIFHTINVIIMLYAWIIILRVIHTWFRLPLPLNVETFLHSITEPILKPIRNSLPKIGYWDLSPIIVLIALYLLRGFFVVPSLRYAFVHIVNFFRFTIIIYLGIVIIDFIMTLHGGLDIYNSFLRLVHQLAEFSQKPLRKLLESHNIKSKIDLSAIIIIVFLIIAYSLLTWVIISLVGG